VLKYKVKEVPSERLTNKATTTGENLERKTQFKVSGGNSAVVMLCTHETLGWIPRITK
jgi:hypothetical protein